MISLTKKERESLLLLFKDFSNFYNANYASKILGISHVGAQKIFKRLLDENLLTSRKIGKSINYKIALEDDYVRKLIAFLLADEANNFKRWKEEFRELFKKERIILMFGSAIKNYEKAKDIDIMVIAGKNEYNDINKVLKEKEKILPKNLHAIKLTQKEMLNNLKDKNKALIEIIKNGIIFYGQDKYAEIIKNVTSF